MAKIKIPTVNEKLLERYIRHSVYLEQLKTGEAKLVSRFLKQKIFPQIYGQLVGELSKVKNLETVGSIRKVRRLKKMLAAVQKISAAGVAKVEKSLINRLVNVSRFEAKWNANMISKTVSVDIDMTMPSNEVLKNLVTMRPMDGHKLGTWMRGYSTAVRVAMTKQIKMGIASGESLPAIGRRINKALNWKGKQAQYIARTAVSNVVHQAKEEVFKKNRDIVRKVQWISTLDDRTSMQCIHLDGKMFDVADGPRPPIHFNCRSSVIPITPSWQEFGIEDPPPAVRASMNGAVPAKMNYRTWLRKQSKATQIKVLGKKRANLYRSGRVKIDRFVGRDLKPLTLKQLARREGIKFIPRELKIPKVKAMSIKGTGAKLTSVDKERLLNWSMIQHENIVKVQLGKPINKLYGTSGLPTKSAALKGARELETTLKKMKGFDGISYRGLGFKNESARKVFLKQFKTGGVWKSASVQSTSKYESITKFFTKRHGAKHKIILEIRGKSGRDIAKYSTRPSEAEILFAKGTSFKVDKIVGNKVYLTEVTKQAQLIKPVKGISFKGIHADYNEPLISELSRLSKKFPAIKKKFGGAELLSGKEFRRLTGGDSVASVIYTKIEKTFKNKIFLNGKYFGEGSSYNVNAQIKRLANKKVLVGTDVKSVATHEFGHVFQGSLSKAANNKVLDFHWNASATTMKKIKNQISKYAAESHFELFAESFTQWQLGKASPMAKKVLKLSGVLK